MATSLARRVRRIGLLPQLTIEELMDDNMKTKLKHATEKAESGRPEDVAYLAELTGDIKRQLLPKTIRRLNMSPEEKATEAAKLRAEAKAARDAKRKAVKGKK